MPPLQDPAANDPQDVKPLATRLESALAQSLNVDEGERLIRFSKTLSAMDGCYLMLRQAMATARLK